MKCVTQTVMRLDFTLRERIVGEGWLVLARDLGLRRAS